MTDITKECEIIDVTPLKESDLTVLEARIDRLEKKVDTKMTEEKIKQDKLSLEESLDERIINESKEEIFTRYHLYREFFGKLWWLNELLELVVSKCQEEFEKAFLSKEKTLGKEGGV